MSERVRCARLALCLLLAAFAAKWPPALSEEDGATDGNSPAASAEEPAVPPVPAPEPAEPPAPPPGPPPGPPPLGPGPAGEGNVPPAPQAVDVAGGEEPQPVARPKNLRTIPTAEAAGILGKRVTGPVGEDIGMVVDVLIDTTGKPRAAVVDFGGFLGVGTRKIAVDWAFLQFRPGDRNAPVLLDVTADAIRAAPEYRPADAETSVVVSPPATEDDGNGNGAPVGSGSGEPGAREPKADGAPAPDVQERAEPPPPSAEGRERPPLPEMKPPERRPEAPQPAAGPPSTDDLGPAPAPALPQIPPDARQ